ncbi:MAG TPA: hypothetical protein VN868_02440 [Terriglobales bacterium]|nr:hypothetical protein [Terriglobales bacterium]
MKFPRALCLLCGLATSAFALEREAFTFANYNLEVRVEPEQQRLGVRGRITLRNDSAAPLRTAVLQISSSLGWKSILLEGKPVPFVSQRYTSDLDHTGALAEAIVTLPRDVPPGSSLELEIGYEGIIARDGTRLTRIGVPEQGARHSDWDQIGKSFTAVRGVGYVAWYPVATESASLSEGNTVFETVDRWKAREAQAQLKIKLSHSGEGAPATLLCNGEAGGLRSDEQVGAGYESVNQCVFQPLGQTVPLFVLGNYDGLDRPSMNMFYLPEHKPAAEKYAAAAQEAEPFVAEWFGTPKGRAEARAEVIELSDPEAAPYESGSMLLMPLHSDSRLAELTAVHQLTHAAFFSARPWIYEGLAHFVQTLYREKESGRQAALDFMGLHRTAAVEAERAAAEKRGQNRGAGESLINTSIEEFYRSKAAYVWWMLRDMIGDEALKQALAAYRPEADKEPAYIQRLIAAQTKRDLEWFFDDWVYRDRGLPDFRVASIYPRLIVGGGYVVTVTIENLGDAGAEVPVILKMDEGQVADRLEVRAKSRASIRIKAASAAREIVVNDGSVPESDMSNNSYKVDVPAKGN